MKKGGRKPTRAEEKNLTTSVHVVHKEVGRRKEIAK